MWLFIEKIEREFYNWLAQINSCVLKSVKLTLKHMTFWVFYRKNVRFYETGICEGEDQEVSKLESLWTSFHEYKHGSEFISNKNLEINL